MKNETLKKVAVVIGAIAAVAVVVKVVKYLTPVSEEDFVEGDDIDEMIDDDID